MTRRSITCRDPSVSAVASIFTLAKVSASDSGTFAKAARGLAALSETTARQRKRISVRHRLRNAREGERRRAPATDASQVVSALGTNVSQAMPKCLLAAIASLLCQTDLPHQTPCHAAARLRACSPHSVLQARRRAAVAYRNASIVIIRRDRT